MQMNLAGDRDYWLKYSADGMVYKIACVRKS